MPIKRYIKAGTKARGFGGLTDYDIPSSVTPSSPLVVGSAPLGQAVYAPPASNVIYLSPTGSDSADGSFGAPKKTLDAAYAACGSSGWTIVLRNGVYRDRLSGNLSKSITIQNYGSVGLGVAEEAWVDGSDLLTVWTNNGNGTWTTSYSPTFSRFSLTGYGGVGAYRNYIDQVFRDGVQLTQIEDATTPAAGQFSVNQTAHTLTIADTPVGHTIEATTRNFFTPAITSPVTLRGFGIRRFSPTFVDGSTNGMFYLAGSADGYVFENMVFQQSALTGVSLARAGTVRNCTFEDMGAAGLAVTTANGMVFQRNVVRRCNRGLWQMQPIIAAFKATRSRDMIIEHNYVEDIPQAGGIWLDVSCLNPIIRHNRVIGPADGAYVPKSVGIEVEIGDGGFYNGVQHYGMIVGNYVTGFETGIVNYDSGYFKFANNDLRGNRYGIYAWQDDRWNDGSQASTRGATATEAPWVLDHLTIMNNMTSQHPLYASIQILVYDKGGHDASTTALPVPPVLLGIEMLDYFGGHWAAPAPPGTALQLGKGADVRNSYNTPAQIAAAGPDVGGPWPAGKLGTISNSITRPPDTIATPLPADIAGAMGVATGLQVLGPPLPANIPSY